MAARSLASASVSSVAAKSTGRLRREPSFDLPLDTPPMEAKLTAELPTHGRWQYEPKWDGFRCLAFKAGTQVELRAKSGKPLARYFPEVVEGLRALDEARLVLDGELLIEIGGQFAFDALQLRLHPAATRIRKLAAETPARLMLFDLLIDAGGGRVLDAPFAERRHALEAFMRAHKRDRVVQISAHTRDANLASRWLDDPRFGTDGVIAKPLDEPYRPGERSMLKVKRVRTADCVVGGFRYATASREVGSLLLGLYDDAGLLHHVGFTSSIRASERKTLTPRLEALIEAPGFTGTAPGGPSRWSTERSTEWEPLRPALVVEVGFDHVTDGRMRHGARFIRWRHDKAPEQCTLAQIERPRPPERAK